MSTDDTRPLELELDNFFDRLTASQSDLITEFDPEWPSTCEQGKHWVDAEEQTCIRWAPQLRPSPYLDFQHLENALEYPIHADIKTYFGRYWSAHVKAHAQDGDLTLLYVWNSDDVDRLIENIIGHAVACRNNKTPFAVFFAVAEPDSDYILTLNNTTGEVQLEKPGYKPERVLAPNLATFMSSLQPGWKAG